MPIATIAALFVQANGVYAGIDGIEVWDEARDARAYDGPWPVVAHPPCNVWCRMAPVNRARYGIPIGSDDGCFVAALAAVRRWGGVLEHPAMSAAWLAHRLPWPPRSGGWQRDIDGGWCCHVEQRHYGHPARKASWLYAVGTELPLLRWGKGSAPEAWISTDRSRAVLEAMGIGQLSKRAASATPAAFRDVLVALARTVVSSPPLVSGFFTSSVSL